MEQRRIDGRQDSIRAVTPDVLTRDLLKGYALAWKAADIEGILSLLADGVTFPVPPLRLWKQGKESICRQIGGTLLAGEAQERWRLPGFAFYRIEKESGVREPFGLQLLTIQTGAVTDAPTFGFPALFRHFGLPDVLMM